MKQPRNKFLDALFFVNARSYLINSWPFIVYFHSNIISKVERQKNRAPIWSVEAISILSFTTLNKLDSTLLNFSLQIYHYADLNITLTENLIKQRNSISLNKIRRVSAYKIKGGQQSQPRQALFPLQSNLFV